MDDSTNTTGTSQGEHTPPSGGAPNPSQQTNTLMAVLAYIGPLVFVSYITAKDEPFVKFHIKQGFVLFVLEVALWILSGALWLLAPLWAIANLALLILAIIGIMNVTKHKEQPLPLIGSYSKYFTF